MCLNNQSHLEEFRSCFLKFCLLLLHKLNYLNTENIFFAVLLVTGGWSHDGVNTNSLTSVEVILPSERRCTLPSLPMSRTSHTQSGLTACGGWAELLQWETTLHSCVTFIAGVWKRSHTLSKSRLYHVAWQSPAGILLMGGPEQTSELLSATTSTTSLGFDMPKTL